MTSSIQENPAVPLAILELYGALDLAVQTNPELGPLVDEYMPGASANQGWSQEIHELFLPGQPRITDVEGAVRSGLERILTIATSPGFTEEEPLITIPDLSNLVYAVGALSHILQAQPGDELFELYAQVLSLAVPQDVEGIVERVEVARTFLLTEIPKFSGWDVWPDFIKAAAEGENKYVMELIAEVPQCRTGVVTVNGYQSVVIDADLVSKDVTFKNLIDVIDPRNWPKSYPSFFCKMENPTHRDDKWYDIKETAGFCNVDGGFKLVTKLRFIKSNQVPDLDARLDFDLGEDQTGCDGNVKVDKGFVNALCTNIDKDPKKGGVLLRTRKVAHVKGISPYAQAFLLCKLGYGWAAVHTFFGPAMRKPPLYGYTDWKEAPLKMEDLNRPDPGTGDGSEGPTQSTGTASASTNGGISKPPKLQVATTTAQTLKDTAEFLTDKNLELTKKWLAEGLNFGDLAAFGAQVGAKLGSEPWNWLQNIVTPPKEPTPPPTPSTEPATESTGGTP